MQGLDQWFAGFLKAEKARNVHVQRE